MYYLRLGELSVPVYGGAIESAGDGHLFGQETASASPRRADGRRPSRGRNEDRRHLTVRLPRLDPEVDRAPAHAAAPTLVRPSEQCSMSRGAPRARSWTSVATAPGANSEHAEITETTLWLAVF